MPPQAPTDGLRDASWEDIISAIAKREKVNPMLALSVAQKESGMDPKAIGDAGKALGLFQMHSGAAQDVGIADRSDPIQNITGGIRYLRQLSDRYDGDPTKILMAYNGGMGNVDKGTISPAAQAYAADVMAQFSQRARATQAAPGVRPPSGRASGAGPGPTDAARTEMQAQGAGPAGRFLGELATSAVVEPVMGIASLAGTTLTEGPVAAAKQIGHGIVDPVKAGLERATASRDNPLEWVKAMVSAIPIYGPGLEEVGEQVASGDIAGAAGRAIGTLVPIRGIARSTPSVVRQPVAAAVKRSAESSMAKLFRAAGDGTPGAERAIQKVIPLAMDQSLLRLTRGRWANAVQEAKQGIDRQIGAAVKGPIGDEVVQTAPVLKGLDDLQQTVTNYVPVDEMGKPVGVAAGRGASDLKAVAYNQRLVQQVEHLSGIIRDHGPTVHLRQLVNLRRDWDDFVYSGKSWLNKDDMVKQYEVRAKEAATDAIRGIIDGDPRLITLSELNKASHLHGQLYSFIADEAFGKGHGIPSIYPRGPVNGIIMRLVSAAAKQPTWRLMNVAAKRRLSEAIAANNTGVVQGILRPLMVGGTMEVGRQTLTEEPSSEQPQP